MENRKPPYVTAVVYIANTLDQLKKKLPNTINSDYLETALAIPRSNSNGVLNVLSYLGLIDEANKPTSKSKDIFHLADDEFRVELAEVIVSAYSDLFDSIGEDAWTLPLDRLVAAFRRPDSASQRVGTERARTFQRLASYVGKLELQQTGTQRTTKQAVATTPARKRSEPRTSKGTTSTHAETPETPISQPTELVQTHDTSANSPSSSSLANSVGLTVRIEINLPVSTDQSTYDMIFKSIKENLLGG